MATNTEKLEKFIAQSVRNVMAEGACTKIQLRQVVDGDSNKPVNDWPIKDATKAGAEDEVEILAAEILTYAQEDADAYQSPCRYVAAAFFGDQAVPSSRSAAFVLRSTVVEVEAGPSESLDQKGLLALAIKQTSVANAHAEQVMRLAPSMLSQAFEAQGNIIKRLSDKLDKSEKREVEVIELFETLVTHQHTHKMEELAAAEKTKRRDQIFGEIRQLGPVLANKLLGKDVFPVNNPPLMMALEAAFDEIPEEAFIEFMSKCPESTRIALAEVVQAFARRKADKAEKAQAAE